MIDISSLVIGSTNKKKCEEIIKIISNLSIRILNLNNFNNVPEIDEDGNTFQENAIKKASMLAKWCNNLVIADDSGLEVEALDNRPGIFSARYAGANATDAMLIEKLLKEMDTIPENKRSARFKCAIAIADSQKLHFVVEAECKGFITKKPVGENGFGYDPVFFLPETGRTFGELESFRKNQISHRAKALSLFKDKFVERFNIINSL